MVEQQDVCPAGAGGDGAVGRQGGGDVVEGDGPDQGQREPLERLGPQGRPFVSAALVGRLATGSGIADEETAGAAWFGRCSQRPSSPRSAPMLRPGP